MGKRTPSFLYTEVGRNWSVRKEINEILSPRERKQPIIIGTSDQVRQKMIMGGVLWDWEFELSLSTQYGVHGSDVERLK